MLSKSQISLIKSLQQKKFRREHQLFIVEGYKSVTEFLHSAYVVDTILYTPGVSAQISNLSKKTKIQEITEAELQKISALTTPQEVLALVHIPAHKPINFNDLKGKFSLVLDGIQDPGNLGTIIRSADWFGFEHIICSPDTVDAYNPKVIQATMGSLARVNISYHNLSEVLTHPGLPIFGALFNGRNIYQTDFGLEGLIVMGNEGNGIRPDIEPYITQAVTIPRIGQAESLNVAMATTLFCAEVSRKRLK